MVSDQGRQLRPPSAERQAAFYELLKVARQTQLSEALRSALSSVNPAVLRQQLLEYVPLEAQRLLQERAVRDEDVFPVPIVLETKPTLVGYYRLLTGVGQKRFYRRDTGMSPFAKMENDGILVPRTRVMLPGFCAAMASVLVDLVLQIGSTLEARDVHDLQMLTLGSNFYGGANNTIGRQAANGVLEAIAVAVADFVTHRSAKNLMTEMPTGRKFTVALANDPDVALRDVTDTPIRNVLAIEIKGGSDAANVYNRGGEAEKSHQAAKQAGYSECWTIIRMAGIDLEKLKRGSPTTDAWFDTAQVVGRSGPDWEAMQRRIRELVGVSVY